MGRLKEIEALGLPADLAERLVECDEIRETFTVAMDAVMGGWAGDSLANLATAIDAHPFARQEFLAMTACFGYRDVPPEADAELVRLGVQDPRDPRDPNITVAMTKVGCELMHQLGRIRVHQRLRPMLAWSSKGRGRTDERRGRD